VFLVQAAQSSMPDGSRLQADSTKRASSTIFYSRNSLIARLSHLEAATSQLNVIQRALATQFPRSSTHEEQPSGSGTALPDSSLGSLAIGNETLALFAGARFIDLCPVIDGVSLEEAQLGSILSQCVFLPSM
jgi:hypothetical protein